MKADKGFQARNVGKSYDRAVEMKKKLDDYWREKGMNPTIKVEPVARIGKEMIYSVRSDMIDGRPLTGRSMPRPT
jgi:hypothetical protein